MSVNFSKEDKKVLEALYTEDMYKEWIAEITGLTISEVSISLKKLKINSLANCYYNFANEEQKLFWCITSMGEYYVDSEGRV